MSPELAEGLSALREVMELAREFRARRVRLGEIEVEIAPEAIAPAERQLAAPDVLTSRQRPQGYADPALWAGGTPPGFPQK